jgi:hypothetical protein
VMEFYASRLCSVLCLSSFITYRMFRILSC